MTSRYEAAAFLRRDLRQQADYFANHSLNRTHCGVRPLGYKHRSPNASTPQWAG